MKHYIKEEKGLTLLEVVVSILIITLILISFYGLLIQSKKAGESSENTVEATYVAQQTMEYMYGKIRENENLSNLISDSDIVANFSFDSSCASSGNCELTDKRTYSTLDNSTVVKVNIINDNQYTNLVRVVTEIDDQTTDPVIMESIWRWK